MTRPTLSIPVAASLGNPKVHNLDNDCSPAKMFITIAGPDDCQYLNVWIKDEKNHRFGMQIGNAQLKELRNFLTGGKRKTSFDLPATMDWEKGQCR